jgi:hypothetical protein
MSMQELKAGDRIRLSTSNRLRGYQPGDPGVVVRELVAGLNGTRYYLVKMDQDDPGKLGVVFTDDEIDFDLR